MIKNIISIFSICTSLLLAGIPLFASDYSELFNQGLNAYNKNNYSTAALIFRKIIDNGENNRLVNDARYYLALSIFQQKKYKDAIYEFKRLLTYTSNVDLRVKSKFWIAESFYFLNDYIQAIEEYKKTLKEKNHKELKIISQNRLGHIYFLQKRYDEAIIEWEKTFLYRPGQRESIGLVLNISEAHVLNSSPKKAMAYLRKLEGIKLKESHTARLNFILGRVHHIKGDYKKALKFYDRITEEELLAYGLNEILYYKGECYLQLKNIDRAISYLEKFDFISEGSEFQYKSKYLLAELLFLVDTNKAIGLFVNTFSHTTDKELKYKSALFLARYYIEVDPAISFKYLSAIDKDYNLKIKKDTLLIEAEINFIIKNYSKAIEIYNQVVEEYTFDEDMDKVHFEIFKVYLYSGDSISADKELNKIEENFLFSKYLKEAFFIKGEYYYGEENYKKSIKYLKSYLNYSKTDSPGEASGLLLLSYIKTDNLKKARSTGYRVISKFKSGFKPSYILALIVYLMENKNNIKPFERYIERNYKKSLEYPRMLKIIGNIYFKQGKYSSALTYYTRLLEIDSYKNGNSIIYQKSLTLYKLKKYRSLIVYLDLKKEIISDADQRDRFNILLGQTYYKLKKFDKVNEYFSSVKMEKLSASDKDIYLKTSLIRKDINRAIEILNSIDINLITENSIEKNREIEFYIKSVFSISDYFINEGDYSSAKFFLSKLTDIQLPESYNYDFNLKMAKVEILQERYEEALEYLESITSGNKKERAVKDFYLSYCYFKVRDNKQAYLLLNKNLKNIRLSENGNLLLREAINNSESYADLKRYSNLLKRNYRGSHGFIQNSMGNYFYRRKKYSTSYKYYYKIRKAKDSNRLEVIYRLGEISHYFYKNKKNALKFYNQLLAYKTSDLKEISYIENARLNISVIYIERKEIKKAQEILKDLVKSSSNMKVKIKASNLLDYYYN